MSDQASTQGQGQAHAHTSSNLSFEFAQLRAKLTSSPKPPPPLLSNTGGPTSLLTSPSSTGAAHSAANPTREVHFPHARPAGAPGTTKCVGRPGRPKLSVNTDVPAVSVPRFASRYGTPWRSAAPARYGPPEMTSAEMGRWLKGMREEEKKE